MVKALGLFVEGKPSLREWWTDAFNGDVGNLDSLQSKNEDSSPKSSGFLAAASDRLESFLKLERVIKPESKPDLTSDEASIRSSSPDEMYSTAATVSNRAVESRLGSLGNSGTVIMTNDDSELEDPTKGGTKLEDQSGERATKLAQQDLMAFTSIKALFSRASHLVRAASDLDGIIFVNASLQDVEIKYAKSSFETSPPEKADAQSMADQSSNTSQVNMIATPSTSFTISINQTASNHSGTDLKTTTCEILGYSLQDEAGGGNVGPSHRQLAIPQSVLQGLLSKYPHGNIFLFDDDGSPFLYEDIEPYPAKGEYRGPPSASKSKSRKFEREKEQMRSYQ